MKDHVENSHLIKFDYFRVNQEPIRVMVMRSWVNRGQAMDLEIWFKIHTNINLKTSLIILRQLSNFYEFYDTL